MTDNQLDIFAEIVPPGDAARFYPGDQWRSQSWEPQHQETILDQGGFARATLMCAWTGEQWVGGFLMTAEESGKVVYVLEIRPGGKIMSPRCTLPLPNSPIY